MRFGAADGNSAGLRWTIEVSHEEFVIRIPDDCFSSRIRPPRRIAVRHDEIDNIERDGIGLPVYQSARGDFRGRDERQGEDRNVDWRSEQPERIGQAWVEQGNHKKRRSDHGDWESGQERLENFAITKGCVVHGPGARSQFVVGLGAACASVNILPNRQKQESTAR